MYKFAYLVIGQRFRYFEYHGVGSYLYTNNHTY
jgi:hypothetical protein